MAIFLELGLTITPRPAFSRITGQSNQIKPNQTNLPLDFPLSGFSDEKPLVALPGNFCRHNDAP